VVGTPAHHVERRSQLAPVPLQKDEVYASGRFSIEPGDTIILFTDGIVEAINSSMEPYGREGIRNIIQQDFSRSAGDLVQAVRADFKRFHTGRRIADDVTIMAIRLENSKNVE
jgi:sigma-B regulation protein RsbU (phosphoserine phosphatase)